MIQNIQGTRIVFSTRSYSYSYFHVFIVNRDMLPPLKSYDFEVGASCSIAF